MTTFPINTHSQAEFNCLLQRSQHRAYSLAYRLTGNATDAEDVVQDAYVRAWAHFDDYDATRSFDGWLNRIITNRVIDLHRRRKRVPMFSLDAPIYEDRNGQAIAREIVAVYGNPEDIIIGVVVTEQLQQALTALPARHRETILLCDVEQYSYQEIADRMHCAIGTVRSRVHRARVMLRSAMTLGKVPQSRSAGGGMQVTGFTMQRSDTSTV